MVIEVVCQHKCDNIKYRTLWVFPVVIGTFCLFRDLVYRILLEHFSNYSREVVKALIYKALLITQVFPAFSSSSGLIVKSRCPIRVVGFFELQRRRSLHYREKILLYYEKCGKNYLASL